LLTFKTIKLGSIEYVYFFILFSGVFGTVQVRKVGACGHQ
jgi:hypothetical protein